MGLMQGKRVVLLGVANDHSIAWSIARRLRQEGAEVALTYPNANTGRSSQQGRCRELSRFLRNLACAWSLRIKSLGFCAVAYGLNSPMG